MLAILQRGYERVDLFIRVQKVAILIPVNPGYYMLRIGEALIIVVANRQIIGFTLNNCRYLCVSVVSIANDFLARGVVNTGISNAGEPLKTVTATRHILITRGWVIDAKSKT